MKRRLRHLVSTTVAFLTLIAGNAWAQVQTLQKQLGTGQATTVAAGQQVVYVIRGSCNSLTADCGQLRIDDVLPPELEVVSCTNQGGFFDTLTCTAGTGAVTAIKNVFLDGQTYALTITTRVRLNQTLAANNIINIVRGGILGQTCPPPPAALPPNCAQAEAPPIDITAPAPNYRVRKQRIDPNKPEANNGNPTASLQIAAGTQVRYRVQLCSLSTTGNLALNNVTLTDTFANTVPATTVVNAGGGTVLGNTISWDLTPAELTSLLGTTNCISREFVLLYPASLNIGDPVNNTVTGTGTDVNGGPIGPGPLTVTVQDQIGGPSPGANLSKSGNDVTPPGTITWLLSANNVNSNVPLDDFAIVDTLPTSPALPTNSIRSGAWPNGNALDYNVVADLYTTVLVPVSVAGPCNGANPNWAAVAGGSGLASSANTLFNAPAAFPTSITGVCWRFRNTNPLNPLNQTPRGFSFTTAPQIVQAVDASFIPPLVVTNCISASWSGPGAPGSAGPACRNQNIETVTPAIIAAKNRIAPNTGNLEPLQEFAYRLTFNHVNNDSTGAIINPVVGDLLPANVEFLGWTAYAGPGGQAAPYLQVLPNYGGSGRTLLRFYWSAAAPAPGSVQQNGSAAAAPNPASFATNVSAANMPRMDISLRIRAGTPPGNGSSNVAYRNAVSVIDNSPGDFTCVTGQAGPDTLDIDGDGNTAEQVCTGTSNYVVVDAAVLEGEKWVRGDPLLSNVDDPTDGTVPPGGVCPDYVTSYPTSSVGTGYTRFPCVARTDHGATFDYVLRVSNSGNQELDNYVLYDVLPFVGDNGSGQPLATSPRNTSWRPVLTGPITVVSSSGTPQFLIEYSTAANGNFCRPEVSTGTYTLGALPLSPTFWQPGCDNTFTASPADFSQVTGFRIRAFSGATNFPVLGVLELRVPMRAPAAGAPPSVIGDPTLFFPSWNSFAHTAFVADGASTAQPLPTAEPRKVGVILPERYRIGNLIWNDLNNNGVANIGEPGINGVQVRLCRDTDGTAGPSAGDTLIADTVTATVDGLTGKYGFDTLPGGSGYYTAVIANQVALRGYLSSTNGEEVNADADGDNNDNGINSTGFVPVCGGGTGLPSGLVTLGATGTTEPTNEETRFGSGVRDDTTPSSFPLPGSGFGGYPDALSNHSVDFGFFLVTDLGDLPDTGPGTGPGNYRTLLRGPGDAGPLHVIVDGLRLGACVDSELDGQPLATALGDDAGVGITVGGSCATAGDDEDGIDVATLNFVTGQQATVTATVTNTTGNLGRVCGFADLNGDGDFSDANESTFTDIGGNVSNQTISLDFGVLATTPATYNLNVPTAPRYFRFRIADNRNACVPDNDVAFPNGEVEDYVGNLSAPMDLGDLPAPTYPTLLTDNGARHPLRSGLQIGACVDSELNGQPSVGADGDDSGSGIATQGGCATAGDDEDGLTAAQLQFPVGSNNTRAIPVLNTTGSAAQLCAFVDWNNDGDFNDVVSGLNETLSVAVPDGTNGPVNVNFGNLPLILPSGPRYLRLRLSTDGGACSASGFASDGEVEDYRINVVALDFGDLPDTGPGTGPANYVTLSAGGMVAHDIANTATTLFLGASVDAEGDGQPNLAANGDDNNGVPDDEDGLNPADLIQVAGLPGIFRLTATNLIPGGPTANICGYVDWNGDGDFDDVNERTTGTVPNGSNALVVPLNFGLVPAGSKGDRYARFRYTTASCAVAGPEGGPIVDGEVEDYLITDRRADLGDLPDTGPGTGPGNYQTLVSDNGAAHGIVAGLHMGACVDQELDGQPSVGADGDDQSGGVVSGTCAVPGDDEDGVNTADLNFIAFQPATVRVNATNTTGSPAFLCGFVDLNGDGDFNDTIGGMAETGPQVNVPTGSNNAQFIINFGTTPVTPVVTSYARFRLSTTPGCQAFGAVSDGEVEDYAVTLTRRDFGDLPDVYGTLLSSGGAYHDIIDNLFMGASVDPEITGVPSVGADGDDLAGVPDDEDGVNVSDLANLHLGSPAIIRVNATNNSGSPAQLCGFIDFNGDGDFDDAAEAAPAVAVPNGSNDVVFNVSFGAVPALSPQGQTYARFRLQAADQPCASRGGTNAGEVEDYVATIGPGEMSLGNLVWEDANNSGTRDPGENPMPNIPVELFVDANNDGTPDGPAIATQTTDGNGNYLFDELVPNHYIVCITSPSTYISSSGTGRPYAPTGPNEPAPDPDNDVDNDDNGTAGTPVTRICSGTVTLEFGAEPINDGDADDNSNLTVDFGLLYNFDLALRKTLGPDQLREVNLGEDIRFTITIFNQGTVEARNITITDYLPAGLELADPNWTAVPVSMATRLIPGPLAPGANTSVDIVVRVTADAVPGPLVNRAEISAAEDPDGPVVDIDSDPDDNDGNDGNEVDDEIGNNGGDEDDADPETVNFGIGVLGAAKQLTDLTINRAGGYGGGALSDTATVSLLFTLTNTGARDIHNLSLTDNLVRGLPLGGSVEVVDIEALGLTVNAGFNGRTDLELLAAANTLPAGATRTISLTYVVRNVRTPLIQYNVANASGNFDTGQATTDASTDGTDPDPDGNGNPGDNSEPTVIDLRGLANAIALPVNGSYGTLILLLAMFGMGLVVLRRRG